MRQCKYSSYVKIICCYLPNCSRMCVKMKLFITNKQFDKTEKDRYGYRKISKKLDQLGTKWGCPSNILSKLYSVNDKRVVKSIYSW
jgi:hypothetical protein